MSFLLSLKHWQAFVLIFVLPFLLQYGIIHLAAAAGYRLNDLLATALDALPTAFLTFWIWQVGFLMFKRLPESIKISAVYFHLGTLYFLLYSLLFIYTLGVVRESITEGTLPFGMLALLIPMHLFASFCFLYLVYFSARSIVSAERQRVVEFGDYILVLIQIIFLPVGIWFLQPRLQTLAHSK